MRISLARLASVWSWTALAALFCWVLFAQTAGATSTSLWKQQGSAPQPGPAVLYQPLAKSPQLENAPKSIWHAKPILISGASAYRNGEFVYQGYIYDDRGAKLTSDPNDPMTTGGGGDAFSAPDGTYTYPSGKGYDENAANLIELRVKPELDDFTTFRISLNTLENPKLVATAIAIGGKEGVRLTVFQRADRGLEQNRPVTGRARLDQQRVGGQPAVALQKDPQHHARRLRRCHAVRQPPAFLQVCLERRLLVIGQVGCGGGFRVKTFLRRVRQIHERRNVHRIEDPGRGRLRRRRCR